MQITKSRLCAVGDVLDVSGGKCKVVAIFRDAGTTKVRVRFPGNPAYEVVTDLSGIRRRRIANPYQPTVTGIGYLGVGPYRATLNKKNTREYAIWRNMLWRCYSPAAWTKHPTYKDCSVDRRWHNFQNFARDITQLPFWDEPTYELDKDILTAGNKVYGPNKCCFVPPIINLAVRRLDGTGINYATRRNHDSPFSAYLKIDGKQVALGSFKTEKAAVRSYRKARGKHLLAIASEYKGAISSDVYSRLLSLGKSLIKE